MLRIVFATILLFTATASVADEPDAKAYYDRGNAAFALGKYDASAQAYERAYELKPDRALLYNAAQAHRLAGNKQRALTLYQNYLRFYGRVAPNRAEVTELIKNLRRALDQDQQAASAPPTSTAAIGGGGTTTEPPSSETPPASTTETPQPNAASTSAAETPPASTTTTTNVNLVATAPPPEKPVYKRGWFWGVVAGAAVVVVVGVAVGVSVGSGAAKDPSPGFGAVRAN